MNEKNINNRIVFHYQWSTNRIAIFCSLAVFTTISAVFLYVNNVKPNILALVLACIFLIPTILRGYGLIISLMKAPSTFHIEDNVIVAKMMNCKIKEIHLENIEELKKNFFESLCSQFSIHIISSKNDDEIIVRDEEENNGKLIEVIRKANANCIIDPNISRQIRNDIVYKPKIRLPILSHKVTALFAVLFLLVSIYSFFTQPEVVVTQADELNKLTHQLFGYLALIPALFLATLSFILFRKNRQTGTNTNNENMKQKNG